MQRGEQRRVGDHFSLRWAAVCWILVCTTAHAVTFSASLDRTTIRLGEQAVLTLHFQGGQPSGAPRVPSIPNLLFQAARPSQSTTLINGQFSQSVSFPFVITASQPGDYTIPAFNVPVAGAMLPSQPLALKVLPATAKISDTEAFRQFTFVKIRASQTNAFVGEPFALEIRLYFVAGSEFQMPSLRGDGFTLAPFQHQQGQEQVGNAVYRFIAFRSVATPVKAGTLALGPAQCAFNLHIRTSGDVFDLFNRGVRAQPVTILSDPLVIDVQPLPTEGRPADFNGAVGNFQMSVVASPVEVAVGDPITLRVQISGRGALDTVRMPLLDWGESFKSYSPSATTEMPDPLSMTGTRKIEQVVQPQNADVKELPAFTFSFFAPDTRSYRTLRQAPIPLRVRATAAAQVPTVVMTATNTSTAAAVAVTELVHIKPHLGAIAPPDTLRTSRFWLVPGVPFAIWIVLIARRKQAEKLANNPRLRRRHEVEKLMNAGLAELRQQAAAAQPEAFFSTLFRLLQEQLGERLDLPAIAITEEVIDERVKSFGADEETCRALHGLFQACNAARYAPLRETSELAKLVDQLSDAVAVLRKLEVEG